MRLKYILSLSFLTAILNANAQAPSGYYTDTAGLTGYVLKTRLHQIIKTGHIDKGYNNLYNGYTTTDRDYYYENDGTLLDVYSEKPNGVDNYNYSATSTGDRCGNYSNEGDCYNREHTIPQSLFNSASPMKNDIQFVIPTDGKVNGQRNNYPYGKVNSPTWTSLNGSKLGQNVAPGYTGVVFEPIDEFKGDIARVNLYFAVRYQDRIPNFSQGGILDGTSTRSLQQWQVDLFLEWHHQDPVSQREIDRNNKAYIYQGNRNPFIDNPSWADCIWKNINCNSTTVDTSDTSTSINNIALNASIDLFPNPTNSILNINNYNKNNAILEIAVLSVDGRILNIFDKPKSSIDIATLNSGIYFVRIYSEKGVIMKKILKQ